MMKFQNALRAGAPLLAWLFLAGAAPAADAVHLRGTIKTVDGSGVTILASDGKTIGLTLDDAWKIGGVVAASLADVKQGTFIGTANIESGDGNKALEVVVFPEALRGTGEGDYGWDLKPKSAMTNANVQSVVEGVDGRKVTLSYKGGQKTVTIPPNVPIVTLAAATKADVQPGAKVFAVGTPSADGAMMTGGRLVVGLGGVTPPM